MMMLNRDAGFAETGPQSRQDARRANERSYLPVRFQCRPARKPLPKLLIHCARPSAREQVSDQRLFQPMILPDQMLQHVVKVRRKAGEKTNRGEVVAPHTRYPRERPL
jgi:hypothetical protein